MEVSLGSPPSNHAQKTPNAAEVHKVIESAHQFEAAMLELFLGPMEKAFSAVPGGGSDEGLGMSGYGDMGTQAMASAISQAGGIGIADMLVCNLLHLQKVPGKATAIGTGGQMELKVFRRTPIVTETE